MKSNLSEYLPVIQKLLEKTQEGRVRWQGGLGTFHYSLGSEGESALKFTLSSVATQDINRDSRFLVMEDSNGNELFRLESNDLPTSAEEEEISNLIDELYDIAHNQALEVADKLDLASSLLDRV